jgi:hypothetical protein
MRRGLVYTFLFPLLPALFLAAPQLAGASEGEGEALSAPGPETLEVTGEKGDDSATGYLTLLNSGESPLPVRISFQAGSDEGLTAGEVKPRSIPSHTAERVAITFSGLGSLDEAASGQLIVEGGESVLSKTVEVKPGLQPAAEWPAVLIGVSFTLALLLGLYVAIGADNADLARPAPGPKLTFESWASTFTAVGAVLGTVLPEVAYPPFPEQIGKDTLVSLNLLFLALIAFAPFSYQALRRSDAGEVGEDEGMVGTNLTLLLACTLTLWAVLGELGTVTLLASELVGGELPELVVLFGAALVFVLAILYFLRTTSRMVRKAWAPAPPAPGPPPAAGVAEAVALEEPRTLDFSNVKQLRLRTSGFPVPTLVSHPERQEVELAVPSSTAATKRHWPLL